MVSSMVNDNATFPNYPKVRRRWAPYARCTAQQQQQCPDHAIHTMMTQGGLRRSLTTRQKSPWV